MAILLSEEFKIPGVKLDQLGIFDALLDEDSHFFINVKRLQSANTPEFIGTYNEINEYFRKISLLLSEAVPNDRLYLAALKMFDFPEVNGINLGFSRSTYGAGFGKELRKQIIKDAYEIIQKGSKQPEIFQLVGLFEENVGPDRLSDMIARLLYDNIIQYSRRIYSELGITKETYPNYIFVNGIPKNPYKNCQILLLPTEILHELPIAANWEDIDRVIAENEVIRKEMNVLVGEQWKKMASSEAKEYIKEYIFKNPKRLSRVIESYKSTDIRPYNIYSNADYLVENIKSKYKVFSSSPTSSYEASIEIMNNYTAWIENNGGAYVIQNLPSKVKEKCVQRTVHAVAMMYCKINNLAISPEVNSGRGPVDFLISRGTDKTVIEIKLSSNSHYMLGFTSQIEEYAKSENKIFLFVNTGEYPERVKILKEKSTELTRLGLNPATLIVINAQNKNSASKFIPEIS